MRPSRSDLADFTYFLVVAKHRSFRLAAVSAVSHALKGLESRLGVRLINRTNRSVTLTTAGQEFRGALSLPFEAINQATDVLNRFRDTPSGHIRLNVLAGAADQLLTPVLPTFFERYPNVLVDVSVTNRMVDVVGQGFDAGIRFGGTVPEDMVAQRLSPEMKWVVAGTPEYFERFAKPLVPADLAIHRCIQIRLGDGSVYRWEFENSGKDVAIPVPGPVILDDGGTAMKLALQGAGLVYMNEWDVHQHVEDGRLLTVLDDWSPIGQGYFIYYSSRRQVPNGVRLLIDLIRELRPLG